MDIDTRRAALITLDWIVCLGLERQVADGRVECPSLRLPDRRGKVSVEQCLDCRHLLATPMDRVPDFMCSAGDPSQPSRALDAEGERPR